MSEFRHHSIKRISDNLLKQIIIIMISLVQITLILITHCLNAEALNTPWKYDSTLAFNEGNISITANNKIDSNYALVWKYNKGKTKFFIPENTYPDNHFILLSSNENVNNILNKVVFKNIKGNFYEAFLDINISILVIINKEFANYIAYIYDYDRNLLTDKIYGLSFSYSYKSHKLFFINSQPLGVPRKKQIWEKYRYNCIYSIQFKPATDRHFVETLCVDGFPNNIKLWDEKMLLTIELTNYQGDEKLKNIPFFNK